MVERRCIFEHPVHVSDAGGVPAADVLVKRRRIGEHLVHVDSAGGIPVAYVLVERRRMFEHRAHVGDVGGVPPADVTVERRRITEHIAYADHAGGVPAADVPVECRRHAEHRAHVSDAGGIPTADVLVERDRTVEHIAHVGHTFEPKRSSRYRNQVRTLIESTVQVGKANSPPVIDTYKLILFGNRAAVVIAVVCRHAPGNPDDVDPVNIVVVYNRAGSSYGFDSAVTPVDSSVHITGQRQRDRRLGTKTRVPGRYKSRPIDQPLRGHNGKIFQVYLAIASKICFGTHRPSRCSGKDQQHSQ